MSEAITRRTWGGTSARADFPFSGGRLVIASDGDSHRSIRILRARISSTESCVPVEFRMTVDAVVAAVSARMHSFMCRPQGALSALERDGASVCPLPSCGVDRSVVADARCCLESVWSWPSLSVACFLHRNTCVCRMGDSVRSAVGIRKVMHWRSASVLGTLPLDVVTG